MHAAVDGVDGHARGRVDGIVDLVAGVYVAAHAVFGGEQGHELHAGSLVQDIDCRLELVVDARRIGDQAYSLALERCEAVVAQHLYAGLYLGRSGQHCGRCEYGCQYLFHWSVR